MQGMDAEMMACQQMQWILHQMGISAIPGLMVEWGALDAALDHGCQSTTWN